MFNKDNIYLRKVEPHDLPFLYQWENDSTAWTDSDTHNPLSQKDLRDYIETSTGDIYKDGQLRLIIERRCINQQNQHNVQTLGCMDIFDFDPRNRKAAVGMYITPEVRGQGVGQTAVQLLEQYAFHFLHLRMLYAIISELNIPCLTIYRNRAWQQVATLPYWLSNSDAIVFEKINTI